MLILAPDVVLFTHLFGVMAGFTFFYAHVHEFFVLGNKSKAETEYQYQSGNQFVHITSWLISEKSNQIHNNSGQYYKDLIKKTNTL
jgi:hypothetical protein